MAGKDITTRLVAAAEAGNLDVVRALLDAGANPDTPDADDNGSLEAASLEGHESVVRLLLDRGADPNWADPHEFRTPLMAAAARGHAGVIRLLVACGARVDESDDYGETALCCAASAGRVDAVRALLEAGADPCKQGEIGTPVEVAQGGPPEVAELLRAAGA
jgi:ankyrin repeat protein